LVDSKPLVDVIQGRNLRFISRLCKQPQYGKYIGGGTKYRGYKSKDELAVRNFLKCLLSVPPLFNLTREELNSYPLIMDYIKVYNPSIILSENSLAVMTYQLKRAKVKLLPVEKTANSEKFIAYVLDKFPSFDVEGFYGLKAKS
jgi:hypothetical protein